MVDIIASTQINNQNLTDLDSLWIKIKSDFKNSFGKEIYEKWFTKIELNLAAQDEVIMSVPSKFLRDWIRREYLNKNLKTRKNIKEIWLKHKPNLKKISVIYIEPVKVNKEADKEKIINNKPQENIVSISKYNNIFSLGIELNPKFTFDNFIVGSCNKLASSLAKVIAKVEESLFSLQDINPLFLYGGVGLGKTHLSQAIAWHIRENDTSSKVVYISAERFMYQFVKALRQKDISTFKERIRSIDILIIDDLQFISGKEGTAEELLNTLNHFIENNKKVVLVCDKSPGDLNDVSGKLKSKIASGFISDFKCPNYETRLEILKHKVKDFNFVINTEILELIASKINSNIRDLEGALKKIAANHIFTGQEISIKNTKELLKDLFRTNHNETTIEKIQKITANYFDIKISDLKSNSRLREIARPRQISMYLCKNLTSKNLPEIGREFGGKNHATVIHAIRKIEELIEENSKFGANIKNLEEKITN